MDGLVEGRIVYFRFSEQDVAQVVSGNRYHPGDKAPAMVTRVWSNGCVNLKVMLDGPDNLWVTSVMYHPEENNVTRSWHWMYSGQAGRGNAK